MLSMDKSMEHINKKAEKLIYKISHGYDTLRNMKFEGEDILFVYGYDGTGSTTCEVLVNAEIFFNENIDAIILNMRKK